MLVAKKIEMQVGGLVPSHFNCIMIGAIIYMQKSNMLNISSYGCWIQLSDIDMHHQQTQPFRAPGQLTGPTFSPVNSPNWSNRCKHSEEIRNLFCPHVLHWIELLRINCTPCPPPSTHLLLHKHGLEMTWSTSSDFPKLAWQEQGNGLVQMAYVIIMKLCTPKCHQMLSKFTDLLQTWPIWVNGGQVCTVPKKQNLMGRPKIYVSSSAQKKTSDSNRTTPSNGDCWDCWAVLRSNRVT